MGVAWDTVSSILDVVLEDFFTYVSTVSKNDCKRHICGLS